jgi:hypothetical protein
MHRLAAWIAILFFAAGLILPASLAAHAPDDADAAWGAPGLVAGHPIDQVEPVREADGDNHCAICHWLRALTHSVRASAIRTPHLALVRITPPPAVPVGGSDTPAAAPARAPPVTL